MIMSKRHMLAATVAGLMAIAPAMPGAAIAGGSVKDEPEGGRKLGFSFNIGGTTDYVFRGVSQSAEDPAFQAGVDVTYGILYVGAWGSGIKFGETFDGRSSAVAEIDWYGGIKPVWGPATFDLGVIYYSYPGARDDFPVNANHLFRELDYVELKAGVSGAFIRALPDLTTGVVAYYSPEYTARQGTVVTIEGTAAYALPKIHGIVPTVSALLGTSIGEFDQTKFAAGLNPGFIAANGEDSYLYWNAGLSLAIDKLTLDFRYWDTDIKDAGRVLATGFCTGRTFQCDERFVFTAKATF
jgi:uncharacterized protein (TIGR02001 family)